jgi:penicillin-binding protein 1A
MMTLLRGVTQHGTGAAAAQLNHPVGGKTGTTSDFTDAWFLGFSPSVTCGVWVGYDSRESLGEKETGAVAALPIWINFMRAAIVGKDDEQFPGDDENPSLDRAANSPPAKLPLPAAAPKAAVPSERHAPLVKPALAPMQKPAAQPAKKASVKPALAPRP